MVGVVGVPATYGGFETLVDQILDSPLLASKNLRVYCERDVAEQQKFHYKGACLKPVFFKANGWQSILHDSVGMWSASLAGGTILILGTSATFWLPLLRFLFPRSRYLVNMAGLEWSRAKWGPVARMLLKYNESVAARHAHVLIADNQGLVDYVNHEYGVSAALIAYGGDQFCMITPDMAFLEQIRVPQQFDFAMARAQLDNNIELILRAYVSSGYPLVFVSNWESCNYGRELRARYCGHPNIFLIGPVYDPPKVKALHSRVRMYVHGHSAGGTNPVLLESMWSGLPTACFDVNFHHHTTKERAFFFRTKEELDALSSSVSGEDLARCGESLLQVAQENYRWSAIRTAYEHILLSEDRG